MRIPYQPQSKSLISSQLKFPQFNPHKSKKKKGTFFGRGFESAAAEFELRWRESYMSSVYFSSYHFFTIEGN